MNFVVQLWKPLKRESDAKKKAGGGRGELKPENPPSGCVPGICYQAIDNSHTE